MVVNLATIALCNLHLFAAWLFQDNSSVGWDPISLWKQMGLLAKVVVIILFIMSGCSIGVMIDRWMAFNAARNQSRSFAPAVAGALREGKIDEAIKVAERNKKSHLAKVVVAGLQEFRAHGDSVAIPAVMIFNYFTNKVEAFDVEMDNSSSELIDYFLKRRSVRRNG